MLRLSCVCPPSIAQRPVTCRYCSSLSVRCIPLQQVPVGSRQTHQACEEITSRANHTAHTTAHEQHTHAVRRISMHASSFPSAASEMAKSALAPCIVSSVADLSSGWHADALLVCACSPLVSRFIPPSLLLPSSFDECGLLAAERSRIPKRHRAKQASRGGVVCAAPACACGQRRVRFEMWPYMSSAQRVCLVGLSPSPQGTKKAAVELLSLCHSSLPSVLIGCSTLPLLLLCLLSGLFVPLPLTAPVPLSLPTGAISL